MRAYTTTEYSKANLITVLVASLLLETNLRDIEDEDQPNRCRMSNNAIILQLFEEGSDNRFDDYDRGNGKQHSP